MTNRYVMSALLSLALAATAGCSSSLQLGGGGDKSAAPRTGTNSGAGASSGGAAATKAEMPDVKGMSPAEAERTIVAAGFVGVRFKSISQGEAPECTPGVVCNSSPEPGTVASLKMPKMLYVIGEVCYHEAMDDPNEKYECEGAEDSDDDDSYDDDDDSNDDDSYDDEHDRNDDDY